DRSRARTEHEQGILDDLDWLGLVPDDGTTSSYRAARPHPLRQSDNDERYAHALSALDAERLVYACRCSRRALEPTQDANELRYPGHCRLAAVPRDETLARRVILDDRREVFDDLRLGPQEQQPAAQCGDVLVRDRVGQWTYQFAVTVDDALQQIDIVIRGEDLLASTGRQLALARLLGRSAPPRFLHHPLIRHPDGAKLSKSRGDRGIGELRAAGVAPAQVLGTAMQLAGLQHDPHPVTAASLGERFAEAWHARD
ncbi:MAG: hypothetical protein K2X99_04200, partial [Gemmatimonadaceae bacterium]|nr:hypothetical protein [Gemmatimonadaceae bacterium]